MSFSILTSAGPLCVFHLSHSDTLPLLDTSCESLERSSLSVYHLYPVVVFLVSPEHNCFGRRVNT